MARLQHRRIKGENQKKKKKKWVSILLMTTDISGTISCCRGPGIFPAQTKTSLYFVSRVNPMAQCRFCGAETVLFDRGIPVCVKCDDEREKANERAVQLPREKTNQEPPDSVVDT
jgi:hypothetical protein